LIVPEIGGRHPLFNHGSLLRFALVVKDCLEVA